MLWSQICEILETSETNLDFTQLYDITKVSEELQNCLDNLIQNQQFTQALEICSLLSLSKDKCIIAMWMSNLRVSLKTEEAILKFLTDSSLAFKDENVNPNLAASFFYEVARTFSSFSSKRLSKIFFLKCIKKVFYLY